jgi:hypothetical protein
MPAISILTPMLPVPRIDGRGTHTFMRTSAHTGDATAAGMSIPRGLDGIGNGRSVRPGEPDLAHKGMRALLVRARCATPATSIRERCACGSHTASAEASRPSGRGMGSNEFIPI